MHRRELNLIKIHIQSILEIASPTEKLEITRDLINFLISSNSQIDDKQLVKYVY